MEVKSGPFAGWHFAKLTDKNGKRIRGLPSIWPVKPPDKPRTITEAMEACVSPNHHWHEIKEYLHQCCHCGAQRYQKCGQYHPNNWRMSLPTTTPKKQGVQYE